MKEGEFVITRNPIKTMSGMFIMIGEQEIVIPMRKYGYCLYLVDTVCKTHSGDMVVYAVFSMNLIHHYVFIVEINILYCRPIHSKRSSNIDCMVFILQDKTSHSVRSIFENTQSTLIVQRCYRVVPLNLNFINNLFNQQQQQWTLNDQQDGKLLCEHELC